MTSTEIPRVDDTDLDRDDLIEAAEELDIENAESLEDQELFERLGRRLGEIDEEDVSAADEDAGGEDAGGESRAASAAQNRAGGDAGPGIREELEGMTRDAIRNELRALDLPVSGSKDELLQRLEAARVGASQAEGKASEAGGKASDAGEPATEATDQAGEQIESAGEQATAASGQAVEQGEEAAAEVGEKTSEAAGDTAQEVAPDRQAARQDDEYRVENDQRENVSPILDLELGPLALDVLGLDIHLNRVHAVLVANPGPKHALLGKLLSGVAKTTDKLGLNSLVGGVTGGVEKLVDALPTPDTGSAEQEEEEEDDGHGPGVLGRIRERLGGAGRSAKDAAGSATDAAGNAKDAAADAVTGGGKAQAAKEAKDALQDSKDAGSSAKDAALGRG